SVSFAQPRLEEREIVVELVEIRRLGEQARLVATTREPRAITALIRHGLESLTCLCLACVERRVDVDQLESLVREARQHLQIVPEDDLIVALHASNLRNDSADAPATIRYLRGCRTSNLRRA